MHATIHNQPGISKYLIDSGARVDQIDETGKTALLFAAKQENIDIVRPLLAAGASVNHSDEYGNTALIALASNRPSPVQKAIAELLIANGADINKSNRKEKKAIDIARENGNSEMVKLLNGKAR